MKAKVLLVAGIASLAVLAFAQNYSVYWYTVDGGGGTCTGGTFSLIGTIGQPDAATPNTSGQYSLVGGFWALPTPIQTFTTPTLLISNAGPGMVTVSWAPPTPGFILQSSDNLLPANWVNAASGSNNPVTLPATLAHRFYRLQKL